MCCLDPRFLKGKLSLVPRSVIPTLSLPKGRNRLLLPFMKQYFVYIMSNKSRRLYVGITSKLYKCVFQHKYKVLPGFTSRYTFDILVYCEEFSQVASAITREKEIKGWRREKKLKLILAENPDWQDLSLEWEEDLSWKAIQEELHPRLERKVSDD